MLCTNGRKSFMHSMVRRGVVIGAGALLLLCAVIGLRGGTSKGQEKAAAARKVVANANIADSYRFNTLGVAHMNQGRPADAQKYFAQALEADPKFAVARLNLGVALLGQQKLEAARAALTDATVELPNDPHGWYNLGLALKDSGEPEKGIVAFRRVTEITPNEADAYYFIGYLSTQLQKYDDAIAAFEQGLVLNPVHASGEFGLARALQRRGDTEAARQHLARFQKITSKHLGTPFGAGYGDQGKFSTAELPVSTAMEVPPAIAVHFAPEARPFVSKSSGGIPVAIGASTGACFFDFDGDGQPDLFLVNGATNGASHL